MEHDRGRETMFSEAWLCQRIGVTVMIYHQRQGFIYKNATVGDNPRPIL